MNSEKPPRRNLKEAILADSQLFLTGLHSGASEELLNAILQRIREGERQLMEESGLRLSPDVWNILQKRLAHRRINDIVD